MCGGGCAGRAGEESAHMAEEAGGSTFLFILFYELTYFETGSHSVTQAGVQWLTGASTSQVQVILVPQPPKWL